MSDIEVTIASVEERTVVENLMQLYTHDFSEHWAGRSEGELGADGRFASYPLDPYWQDEAHIPLLLRSNGRLVGFALINATSHTGNSVDRNMAEFFIVRKHRRGGMGTAAAHAIFSRYPGQWEAAVARRNIDALSFWRNAVMRHSAAEHIEECDVKSNVWNGPVLRFRIRDEAAPQDASARKSSRS